VNHKETVANLILWAGAIVASAWVGAPAVLSLIVLPALATGSLLVAPTCRQRDRASH